MSQSKHNRSRRRPEKAARPEGGREQRAESRKGAPAAARAEQKPAAARAERHGSAERKPPALSSADEQRGARKSPPPSFLRAAAGILLAVLLGLASLLTALPEHLKRRAAKPPAEERRAGKFPESDRRPMQLMLMLSGLLPMWQALAREGFTRGRHRLVRFETAAAGRRGRRGRLRPAVFAAGATAAACGAAFFSLYTTGTTVSYRGEPIETVGNAAEARQIAAGVEALTTRTLGRSFALPEDSIEYSDRLVLRSEVAGGESLERELTDEMGLVTYGYSLYIDDELIGSTQYEGALEALLEQIKQSSVSADTLSADFVEDVRVSAGYVPTESLVNLGYIAEAINSTKTGEEIYTVSKGDTWGKIAWDHGMSNNELLALNPGYDIDRINIGDELVLSKEVPYLTVRVTERQNYVEQINYDIDYVDDASMYKGDTRVIDKGEYGTADLVADVEYVNGVETSRTVISQVMLTMPKTETRARGTKERPSWMATGSFRWPASGRVTSGFGHRNTGIRGASTNHMGIDIACSYGSPIYAADGGTVTYTGYKGAMGYTVIIDHGNGFVTYYEHCASFTCKAGDHVYKGQQIARVGSSGVASGAHCHFGVQKNGSYVNPINYLP